MHLVRRLSAFAFTGALLLGAACSDDDDNPTGPTVAQVSGNYRATRFLATTGSLSQDILETGGSLTATFNSNGTLTGHVTVPTQDVDEDFAGEWKIENGKVEIEEVPTDIFVEDLNFSVVGNTLVGDQTFSGVRVQVTLTKQ
jgi:hypothetical protein